jgi:uncharacterized protein (TIRG00374 family)
MATVYNTNMSFRSWMSIITAVLLLVILFLARHELFHAWQLLSTVNIGILLLIIPIQMLTYYAAGEMIFEYLRTKGSFGNVSRLTLMRMSLELNFVNHTLPSGGVSGVSYMAWRLGKYGVSPGRATMAQVVRYATGFAAFITLLLVAVLMVTIDGNVNRWIIFVSSILVGVMVTAVLIGIYVLSSKRRLGKFSNWLIGTINPLVKRVTFGRVIAVLKRGKVETFFEELHTDFLELRRDKRGLIKPFLWGLVLTIAEAALFMITFLALGATVNPAPILIAYGVASMAGFFVVTPGGAGAYEAIMVAFLALAGVASSIAIAGILLTRVILLLSTVILGYAFYQHAILKYGKGESPIQR